MRIKNIETGKQYPVTKEGWDSLGKRQKVFKVIDYKDSDETVEQSISNKVGTSLKREVIKEPVMDSKKDSKEGKIKPKIDKIQNTKN